MGSEKKSSKEEKKKHKKRSSPSASEDEGRSKRRKTVEDEERKRSKSDKKEKRKSKKSHKHSKHHSDKEKKSGDKHKDKHHKRDRHSTLEFQELSNDDYFLKNNEFATWLKDERKIFFSDLSSESARELFTHFVKDWNNQNLEPRYYEGIESGPRTAHNWKIK